MCRIEINHLTCAGDRFDPLDYSVLWLLSCNIFVRVHGVQYMRKFRMNKAYLRVVLKDNISILMATIKLVERSLMCLLDVNYDPMS